MKRFSETVPAGRSTTELRGIKKPFSIRYSPMKIISTVVLLYALTTGFAPAATLIGFDDLPTPALGGTVVPNGYGGLNWRNVFYLDAFNNNFGLPEPGSPGSGYHNAVHTRPNVAFMGDDSISEYVLVSGPAFHFYGAYLTAAWYDGLNVRVRGYASGSSKGTVGALLYDRTVIVNTSGPTFFTFNYYGIGALRFDTSGGTPGPFAGNGRFFAIDSMIVAPAATPIAQDLFVVALANVSTPIVLKGSDPNGLPLTFSTLFPGVFPSHGTLSGTAPNLIYTPFHDYSGHDAFTYVVSNGTFTSVPAQVSITVKHGLSINNISLTEGNSGTKAATFTVTMTPPSSELDVVTFSFRTADGTANAGSDYLATSGTITIPPGVTSQLITVPVIGDTVLEPNETFLVQLFNASANAVIVNGTGRGTIVNDEGTVGSRVGTAALAPENSVVAVGERADLRLTWTHPVGWRKLNSVDLLLVDDEGEALVTRWHETENSFSLFNPDAERFTRSAAAGSPVHFETSAVRLQVQESTGGGPPGHTVTIEYSLSFKPHAAGRTFSVEAFATGDNGDQQGFESVGTIKVSPR